MYAFNLYCSALWATGQTPRNRMEWESGVHCVRICALPRDHTRSLLLLLMLPCWGQWCVPRLDIAGPTSTHLKYKDHALAASAKTRNYSTRIMKDTAARSLLSAVNDLLGTQKNSPPSFVCSPVDLPLLLSDFCQEVKHYLQDSIRHILSLPLPRPFFSKLTDSTVSIISQRT